MNFEKQLKFNKENVEILPIKTLPNSDEMDLLTSILKYNDMKYIKLYGNGNSKKKKKKDITYEEIFNDTKKSYESVDMSDKAIHQMAKKFYINMMVRKTMEKAMFKNNVKVKQIIPFYDKMILNFGITHINKYKSNKMEYYGLYKVEGEDFYIINSHSYMKDELGYYKIMLPNLKYDKDKTLFFDSLNIYFNETKFSYTPSGNYFYRDDNEYPYDCQKPLIMYGTIKKESITFWYYVELIRTKELDTKVINEIIDIEKKREERLENQKLQYFDSYASRPNIKIININKYDLSASVLGYEIKQSLKIRDFYGTDTNINIETEKKLLGDKYVPFYDKIEIMYGIRDIEENVNVHIDTITSNCFYDIKTTGNSIEYIIKPPKIGAEIGTKELFEHPLVFKLKNDYFFDLKPNNRFLDKGVYYENKLIQTSDSLPFDMSLFISKLPEDYSGSIWFRMILSHSINPLKDINIDKDKFNKQKQNFINRHYKLKLWINVKN